VLLIQYKCKSDEIFKYEWEEDDIIMIHKHRKSSTLLKAWTIPLKYDSIIRNDRKENQLQIWEHYSKP